MPWIYQKFGHFLDITDLRCLDEFWNCQWTCEFPSLYILDITAWNKVMLKKPLAQYHSNYIMNLPSANANNLIIYLNLFYKNNKIKLSQIILFKFQNKKEDYMKYCCGTQVYGLL